MQEPIGTAEQLRPDVVDGAPEAPVALAGEACLVRRVVRREHVHDPHNVRAQLVALLQLVREELLALMAPGGFVFALSNPDPEVHPDVAARYAAIVATGRSDFPNQINNVLAFPGVFRGALDAGARRITEAMKLAAAEAIFSVVADDLAPDRIVPSPFDPRVAPAVAAAVAAAADRG